ncbi:MAG TPA: hypothetical protein VGZ32_12570 [Actinocrinis sp.]|uniref:hypothetical protein n=1 Tax=Actinocrinis sp. TaxID=1920516 RepID=UPI002DDCB676|nr:hypothetical protein [Actinocrinis sp.]HEV3171174.1 hypothetical protein [Actinocrinis sp.]
MMRPATTARWATGGAALALACAAGFGTAQAATMTVAHPSFPVLSNVPYAPLAGVSAASATNAWAVGRDDGSVLTEHWNGSSWTQVGIPAGPCDVFESSCQFTGVSTDAAGDAVAVGNAVLNDNGWVPAALAYQWSAGAWHAMTVPSSINYMSLAHVKVFSAANALAVGAGSGSSGNFAVVTHWDGTAWTQTATPFTFTLGLTINAISATSPGDVWIGGKQQSSGYHNRVVHSVLEHFNGSAWSDITLPDDSGVLDVAAASPTSVWVLTGDGSVLNWNGSAWSVSAAFNGGKALVAVSATDVWVGGIFVNSTLSVAHYNGSSWTTASAPAGIDSITSGAALPTGSFWFAGLQWPPNGDTAPAVLAGNG